MVNCHASIKGLFGGMIVFSCTLISIILYSVFRNKIDEPPSLSIGMNHPYPHLINTAISGVNDDPLTSISNALKRIDYSIVILEIMNLCLLALSLFATMWSLIKIRKLNYRRTTTRKRIKSKFFEIVILLNRF
jgi:hypothetical protein